MLLVFTLAFLILGEIFWILAGHKLSYEVGSSVNGEYISSHRESFSFLGKLIITGVVALAGSGLILLVTTLAIGQLKPISVSIRVFKKQK